MDEAARAGKIEKRPELSVSSHTTNRKGGHSDYGNEAQEDRNVPVICQLTSSSSKAWAQATNATP